MKTICLRDLLKLSLQKFGITIDNDNDNDNRCACSSISKAGSGE